MTDSNPQSAPVPLYKPQLRPVIEPLDIPPLAGPLRIYRDTLVQAWAIMSNVVDQLVLRVRIGGQDFEADTLDALDEQRDAVIDELEIKERDGWFGIEIRRAGRLVYAAVPRGGSAATPVRREAMRQAMHVLRATRRQWWFVKPIAWALIVLATVGTGSAFYLTRHGVPLGVQAVTITIVCAVLAWPSIDILPRALSTEIHVGYRQQYPTWWPRHRGHIYVFIVAVVAAAIGSLLTVVFEHVIH